MRWTLLLLLPFFGCSDTNRVEEPVPAPPVEVEEVAAEELPVEEPIDLLPTHATALAVSSTTPSLQSGPRFLLDGSFDTPWASRTGDDAAFIEVELPADARVARIEMTAGFTKVDGRHDRFLQNLRIQRVRVLHQGELVKSVELETESRELQSIPVEGGGGVWRIEIEETIPGTMPGYREVCVSELRVMGHGSPSPSAEGPELRLGGLEGQAINDIRQARVDLAGMKDGVPEESFGDWWDRATVALHAFPMRCAFPRLRRSIARKVGRVFELNGQLGEAQRTIDDVACPGAGLSNAAYEILGDIRSEAEDRVDELADEQELALMDVQILYGEWAHHCEGRVAPPERLREEALDYADAFMALDRELERQIR